MMPESLQTFPDAVAVSEFDSEAILHGAFDRNELTLEIAAARIVPVCEFLRDKQGYNFLADLTCRDNFPVEPRFQVVYHLYNIEKHQFLRVKASLPGDNPRIATAASVWPAAGWHEREVFDLFGIFFEGHTDLRRILLPDTWEGHPLRRDYPTEGPR